MEIYRYTISPHHHEMGLGSLRHVSLKQTREHTTWVVLCFTTKSNTTDRNSQ